MGKRRRAGQLNDGLVCRGWLECVRVLLLLQTFLALCVAFLHLSAEFLPLSLYDDSNSIKRITISVYRLLFFLHVEGLNILQIPKKSDPSPVKAVSLGYLNSVQVKPRFSACIYTQGVYILAKDRTTVQNCGCFCPRFRFQNITTLPRKKMEYI